MFRKIFILKIIFIEIFASTKSSDLQKYYFETREFSDCLFQRRLDDLAEYETEWLITNNTINSRGHLEVSYAFHDDIEPMEYSIKIQQELRGFLHIATLRGKDFCKDLFDPTTLWFDKLTQYIPEEQRICPFVQGQKIDWIVKNKTTEVFFDKDKEGLYSIEFRLGDRNKPKSFCKEIDVKLVCAHCDDEDEDEE